MKKTSFVLAYAIFCLIFILFSFEFIYRWQIIDTYAPELKAYNIDDNLKDEENAKTILIMGDSFTAGAYNYPDHMQKKLQDWRIINSAMSGTGVIQASITAPKRFKRFKPSIFIYQVYVGNDLFDISYPVNWETISFLRNTYWAISNYFRSISFLNYRLGQIGMKRKIKSEGEYKQIYMNELEDFSVEKYNKTEIVYKDAEPQILENQIMVKSKRKEDFDIFIRKLEELISYCKHGECKSYILIIPNASQVSIRYLINLKHLGFIFNDNMQIINRNEYPFIKQIRQRFNSNDVQILNPIQSFKNNEKENIRMYYQNDGHLNPHGQEVLADYVMSKINFN